MSKFYNMIYSYKNNNPNVFVDIIEAFDPLLNKYQRNGCYEDIKNDLIEFMFLLLLKLPIEKDIFKEDKYIVSYIHKSLNNRYIYLNKKNKDRINREIKIDNNYIEAGYNDNWSTILFEDMIDILTELEKDIINKIYNLGYYEAEIARYYNVSRQAINKTHKRALSKIQKKYLKTK